MRVTRLEIFGFKSFMERLVLPLECGVTGVVGPNGCGKSNVVDAIRWVLGETRARSLRGGTLEDIIFNGTSKLRPLGLAEVSLTLRATEENFFADLVSPQAEVETVSAIAVEEAERELDRTEREIEGIVQDVDGLPQETAEMVGATEESTSSEGDAEHGTDDGGDRPRFSVIEGRKEGDDAEERSAGDVLPDNTSHAAISTLDLRESIQQEGIPTLLQRFSWLKATNEVQVTRRYYRSGESEYFINQVPCRLRDVKDLFRAVGLGARAYTIVAQGEVSRIITARPEERRKILEEAAGVLGFRDKIAAADRRLKDTSVNISRIEDITKEVGRQVATLRRQAAKAKNRQALKEEIAGLERELYIDGFSRIAERRSRTEEQFKTIRIDEERAGSAVEVAQAEEEAARGDLVSVDVEGDQIRAAIDSIREELNNRQRQRSEKVSRINELKAFSVSRGTELSRLEERRATLGERREQLKEQLRKLGEQEAESAQRVEFLEQQVKEDDLEALSEAVQSARSELREKDQELRSVREELISKQSSLDSIREQIIAASPISQIKKTLGDQQGELFESLSGTERLFVDGLDVPKEYGTAVQSFLAERVAFLMSDNPREIALRFVDETLAADPENRKGLGLGILRAGNSTVSQGQRALSSEDCDRFQVKPLLSLVQVDNDCKYAAEIIFRNVYLAPSLTVAFDLFEALSQPESEIVCITPEGEQITACSFYSLRHQGGLVQLQQRSKELEELCDELAASKAVLDGEREEIASRLEGAELSYEEAFELHQTRQAEIRTLSNQLASTRGQLQSERRQLDQLEGDDQKLVGQIREAHARIEEFDREQQAVLEELKLLATEEDDQSLKSDLEQLSERSALLEQQRREGRNRLSELAHGVNEARRQLDVARSRLSQTNLEKQKLDLETENLTERILADYGQELLSELQTIISGGGGRLSDDIRLEHKDRVAKLKQRIAREGDVDPSSIERFEEESNRLEELEGQHRDLQRAASTLERTIKKLTETSETRFVDMFNRIAKNFEEIVPRLFGGGKGSLELSDPSNPLECGIEIVARPPGKKLKSIELLSGGEKALCAIALIVSMFIERPSPLCILDEVDAPLDEANLIRFNTIVREMSVKTQFIVVTHNKPTMAACDHLVGVTMEQPGASKVVTVTLDEAYSQVA